MPELPEVETVRRGLSALLAGRRILGVEVSLRRIVRSPGPEQFARRLQGAEILGVRRRGKYLLIDVEGWTLVSHLRMEGRYGLYPREEPREAHTHVVFALDGGEELRYRDVRQFGTMDLVTLHSEESLPGVRGLGREPVESGFDDAYLRARLRGRRTSIKAALLNQEVVAGLGNIYADEILFQSGIHPGRRASGLRAPEVRRLREAAVDVIARAIDAGGSSVKSYVNGFGEPGGFQHVLKVYGRDGKPCLVCGANIVKGRIAGRGTHVCLRCQPPPRKATGVWRVQGAGSG